MTRHAIVIGGGPGGLVTAHALAGRNWQVTVLERAEYPSASAVGPHHRRGAPQSHCLHMLMGAGAAAFDELVPDWRSSIVQHGAVPFDALKDTAMRLPSGWLPREASGITMYACSRTLLENVLHTALLRQTHAQVLQNVQVVGLDVCDNQVLGVRTAAGTAFSANLVVDASGTASRLPHWLAEYSSDRNDTAWPETVIASPWHYVSRWFQLAHDRCPNWQCLSAAPDGDGDCAAMMLRAEHDCWNVVLLGRNAQEMPKTDGEFLGFTAQLADGRLNQVLEGAVPTSPIHHYGRTSNRWRRLDRLANWPDGLVALGDSVLTLDPYFGLGMTNAAQGAVLLAKHLDRAGVDPFDGSAFQSDLADQNAAPWRLVTGHETDGAPLRQNGGELALLYDAAPDRSDIARAIVEVQHLLRPAESLLTGVAA